VEKYIESLIDASNSIFEEELAIHLNVLNITQNAELLDQKDNDKWYAADDILIAIGEKYGGEQNWVNKDAHIHLALLGLVP